MNWRGCSHLGVHTCSEDVQSECVRERDSGDGEETAPGAPQGDF